MKNIFEKLLINSKVVELNRICDLIRFVFQTENGDKIYVHLQCYLRIFDSMKSLVVCTQNLYNRSPNFRKKWYKKYDWTETGSTVFDDSINEHKYQLFESKVCDIKSDNGDLKFEFENGMRIDVLVYVTKYDDKDYCENYRIFDDDITKESYVI